LPIDSLRDDEEVHFSYSMEKDVTLSFVKREIVLPRPRILLFSMVRIPVKRTMDCTGNYGSGQKESWSEREV
jgi:hypothetical protein